MTHKQLRVSEAASLTVIPTGNKHLFISDELSVRLEEIVIQFCINKLLSVCES